MIRVNCTSCHADLTIDDAFAGGVCRCQHCGTIQTVPAADHGSGTMSSLGKPTKTLYQRKGRSDSTGGTDLDQLAEIVASSGLSGSGLTSNRLHRPPAGQNAPAVKPRSLMPIIIGAVTLIVVLIVLCIWLAMRGGSGPSPSAGDTGASSSRGSNQSSTATPIVGPSFLGVKLDVPSVVYVLDRGSGTKEYFSGLKEVCFASIATLGSDRKFEVIFWSNGSGEAAYPENSMTYATAENLSACRRVLEDVYASGQSDARIAMKSAFSRNPSVVILATGKGWDLDDEFVKMVKEARGSSPAKVYTFAIGGSGNSKALKEVARLTGGIHRDVTDGELKSALW